MSKFKIGDKVMLSPKSRWVDYYSRQPESYNPLGVVGMVYGFNTMYDCNVVWDNGNKNSYRDEDLIPIPDAQPQYECPYTVIEELQCHVETLEEALEKVTKELLELREKVNSSTETSFKPIADMTMGDWKQALREGWVFEMGDGEEVVVDSIMGSFNDRDHPIELSLLTGDHEATVSVKGYFYYDRPDHHRNVKQRIK